MIIPTKRDTLTMTRFLKITTNSVHMDTVMCILQATTNFVHMDTVMCIYGILKLSMVACMSSELGFN